MANDGAQGTTLTFAGTSIGKITDISFSQNGTPVEVTNLADTVNKFLGGTVDYQLNVTVIGISNRAIYATGAISVAFFDGTTDTGGANTFILMNKVPRASRNQPLGTELQFRVYGG